ncbi:glucose-1-phosphate thymidylyltransferase RfbA [Candidatus Marinimicrobia bacterium]|nr:glucose-1-phosphate thymidylyltransferase RfbA [Candidatus Neomarinimicrobiota bacterium]
MKGIILAGGYGKRLYPITKVISKQLLPVYNKPMIYYPLSTLMLSGIRDILIISTPYDIDNYKLLLGDGSNFGIKISYEIQDKPNGLAEAFIIGEQFIGNDDVCLILGDNIFYGKSIPKVLKSTSLQLINGNESIIFGYYVKDPQRYGVVDFDSNLKVKSIDEKPENPKSNYAVVGLYFLKNDVINIAKECKPSDRGELEITSINNKYLDQGRLNIKILDSIFWLDTGTHDALVEASNFIKTVENREGKRVSCLEEIAYKYKYIDEKQLKKIINNSSEQDAHYLKQLIV